MEELNQIMQRIQTNIKNTKASQTRSSDLYKCSKCKDTGFVFVDGKAYKCECYDLEIAERIFKASGIKDVNFSFNNFNECNETAKRMKNIARAYYQNFMNIRDSRRNSIAFLGQVGCGKTHLSIALAMNLLRQKKVQVIYLSYREVITALKQNMLDEEYYKKQIWKYQTCKVLLIDDLLKGKITEADKNILFEIINYRYINRLPMIISSELNSDELLDFDEAIGSRIVEMCKDYLVQIDRDKRNNYRLR